MLRKLLFAAALCLAVPATPQTAKPIPADIIARAKFPHDDPGLIDALSLLNKFVNAAIQPESDKAHYGVDEMWVMLPADGKGDCEDFALSKLYFLSEAGFPIVTNSRVVGVMIHRGKSAEGHAILALKLPSGAVAYMDNLNDELMTRPELERQGYEIVDWRA